MSVRVIALCGARRSGKDAAADHLVEALARAGAQAAKVHFAAPLKAMVREGFGLSPEQLDGPEKDAPDATYGVTPRRILQFMGTEVMQHAIGALLPDVGREFLARRLVRAVRAEHASRVVIVADMRFPHEAACLEAAFGAEHVRILRIRRAASLGTPRTGEGEDAHASEVEFEDIRAHVDIANDGTLADLHAKLDFFVATGGVIGGSRDSLRQPKRSSGAYWALDAPIVFPPPSDANVNMMPFRLDDPEGSLPEALRQYAPLIRALPVQAPTPPGHIAYLTVAESFVPAGGCQRRPGMHVERPAAGCVAGDVTWVERLHESYGWGGGSVSVSATGTRVDGIYMASTVADTCTVWPYLVEIADAHGGVEYLRGKMISGRSLKAGELVWITDRTPHEATPQPAAGYRQFFRVVVGRIGVWYSRHNTANPLGVLPDAPVSDKDKFASLS
jgi:hypothetical protein